MPRRKRSRRRSSATSGEDVPPTRKPAPHARGGTHRVKDSDLTGTKWDNFNRAQLVEELKDREGLYKKDMRKAEMARVLAADDKAREEKKKQKERLEEQQRETRERKLRHEKWKREREERRKMEEVQRREAEARARVEEAERRKKEEVERRAREEKERKQRAREKKKAEREEKRRFARQRRLIRRRALADMGEDPADDVSTDESWTTSEAEDGESDKEKEEGDNPPSPPPIFIFEDPAPLPLSERLKALETGIESSDSYSSSSSSPTTATTPTSASYPSERLSHKLTLYEWPHAVAPSAADTPPTPNLVQYIDGEPNPDFDPFPEPYRPVKLPHYAPMTLQTTATHEPIELPGRTNPPSVGADHVPKLSDTVKMCARNGVLIGTLRKAIIETGASWLKKTEVQGWNGTLWFHLPPREVGAERTLADVYREYASKSSSKPERYSLRSGSIGVDRPFEMAHSSTSKKDKRVQKMMDIYATSEYRPPIGIAPVHLDWPDAHDEDEHGPKALENLFYIRFPGCEVPHFCFWLREGDEWQDPTQENPKWSMVKKWDEREARKQRRASKADVDSDEDDKDFFPKEITDSDLDLRPHPLDPTRTRIKKAEMPSRFRPSEKRPPGSKPPTQYEKIVSRIERELYDSGFATTLAQYRDQWLADGKLEHWKHLTQFMPQIYPSGALLDVPPVPLVEYDERGYVKVQAGRCLAEKLAAVECPSRERQVSPIWGDEAWTRDDDEGWDVDDIVGGEWVEDMDGEHAEADYEYLEAAEIEKPTEGSVDEDEDAHPTAIRAAGIMKRKRSEIGVNEADQDEEALIQTNKAAVRPKRRRVSIRPASIASEADIQSELLRTAESPGFPRGSAVWGRRKSSAVEGLAAEGLAELDEFLKDFDPAKVRGRFERSRTPDRDAWESRFLSNAGREISDSTNPRRQEPLKFTCPFCDFVSAGLTTQDQAQHVYSHDFDGEKKAKASPVVSSLPRMHAWPSQLVAERRRQKESERLRDDKNKGLRRRISKVHFSPRTVEKRVGYNDEQEVVGPANAWGLNGLRAMLNASPFKDRPRKSSLKTGGMHKGESNRMASQPNMKISSPARKRKRAEDEDEQALYRRFSDGMVPNPSRAVSFSDSPRKRRKTMSDLFFLDEREGSASPSFTTSQLGHKKTNSGNAGRRKSLSASIGDFFSSLVGLGQNSPTAGSSNRSTSVKRAPNTPRTRSLSAIAPSKGATESHSRRKSAPARSGASALEQFMSRKKTTPTLPDKTPRNANLAKSMRTRSLPTPSPSNTAGPSKPRRATTPGRLSVPRPESKPRKPSSPRKRPSMEQWIQRTQAFHSRKLANANGVTAVPERNDPQNPHSSHTSSSTHAPTEKGLPDGNNNSGALERRVSGGSGLGDYEYLYHGFIGSPVTERFENSFPGDGLERSLDGNRDTKDVGGATEEETEDESLDTGAESKVAAKVDKARTLTKTIAKALEAKTTTAKTAKTKPTSPTTQRTTLLGRPLVKPLVIAPAMKLGSKSLKRSRSTSSSPATPSKSSPRSPNSRNKSQKPTTPKRATVPTRTRSALPRKLSTAGWSRPKVKPSVTSHALNPRTTSSTTITSASSSSTPSPTPNPSLQLQPLSRFLRSAAPTPSPSLTQADATGRSLLLNRPSVTSVPTFVLPPVPTSALPNISEHDGFETEVEESAFVLQRSLDDIESADAQPMAPPNTPAVLPNGTQVIAAKVKIKEEVEESELSSSLRWWATGYDSSSSSCCD